LSVKPSSKGLGAYEITCETTLKGEYTMHVKLDGMPIGGSPGVFTAFPALPTAARSKLLPPTEPCVTHQSVTLELVAVDKLGNALDRGGARVDARVLGPNAGACTVDDRKDGTYTITFTTGAVGEYRVIARLDNVEMTPLPIQFAEGLRPAAAIAAPLQSVDVTGIEHFARSPKSKPPRKSIAKGMNGAPSQAAPAILNNDSPGAEKALPANVDTLQRASRMAAAGAENASDEAFLTEPTQAKDPVAPEVTEAAPKKFAVTSGSLTLTKKGGKGKPFSTSKGGRVPPMASGKSPPKAQQSGPVKRQASA
jgi:hypothetical protein